MSHLAAILGTRPAARHAPGDPDRMGSDFSPAAPPRLEVRAYARVLRAPLALASALSASALVVIALAVAAVPVAGGEGLRTTALLAGAALLATLPQAASALARRAARGTVHVERGVLVVEAGGRRIETPVMSLGAARPRRLPLPSDGVALQLASGGPFPLVVETDEPAALLDLLSATGAAGVSRPAARLGWARARARLRPGSLELALRWILLPAAVAAVLFRTQELAFGETLGEWPRVGSREWLETLASNVAVTFAVLALLAAAVRSFAELGAALWTSVVPSQAGAARHAAEWLCRAVLFAGVPAVLALRLLA